MAESKPRNGAVSADILLMTVYLDRDSKAWKTIDIYLRGDASNATYSMLNGEKKVWGVPEFYVKSYEKIRRGQIFARIDGKEAELDRVVLTADAEKLFGQHREYLKHVQNKRIACQRYVSDSVYLGMSMNRSMQTQRNFETVAGMSMLELSDCGAIYRLLTKISNNVRPLTTEQKKKRITILAVVVAVIAVIALIAVLVSGSQKDAEAAAITAALTQELPGTQWEGGGRELNFSSDGTSCEYVYYDSATISHKRVQGSFRVDVDREMIAKVRVIKQGSEGTFVTADVHYSQDGSGNYIIKGLIVRGDYMYSK